MDVINAAKKISEAGSKLDTLATKIADQVSCVFSVFLSKFVRTYYLIISSHNRRLVVSALCDPGSNLSHTLL